MFLNINNNMELMNKPKASKSLMLLNININQLALIPKVDLDIL